MSELPLDTLHFVRPAWLLAVPVAALLAWLWARRRRRGSHWESRIEPALLDVLLEPSQGSRSRHLPWLLTLALCAGALGLAGPSWERLPQPVERKTDALVVVFDLSLSMFAEDLAPSRLIRARQKIADVLRQRDEGFTALVAYAGDAHVVAPLTDDTRTIENLLPSLEPDMMPVLGSDLASGLEQARALLENAGMRRGRILVVADAVDDLAGASNLRNRNYPVSVLGVGTAEGARIPLHFVNQPGQVLRTEQGDAVVARLDEQRLEQLAESAHGRYHGITVDDADIDHLLATPLAGSDETGEVAREFDTWADMGFWVCVLLIPLILGGFRRGTLALVPVLLWPAPADAGLWDDLWQRQDQQAYEALTEGEPEAAAAMFEAGEWRAAALYRSGEYESAARSYAEHDSQAASYNRGNALARSGDYEGAIAAYDEVLSRNPEHDDARFNKTLVERLLEEKQASEQQDNERRQQGREPPDEGSDSRGSEGGDDPGDPGDEPSSEPPEQPDQPARSDRGDAREANRDAPASRDERSDALEQWLRRVPDDPGGLLRRKFQYETNQRLREGDYGSQQSEKIW